MNTLRPKAEREKVHITFFVGLYRSNDHVMDRPPTTPFFIGTGMLTRVRLLKLHLSFSLLQAHDETDYAPTDPFVLKKRSIKGTKPYETTTLSDAPLW